MTVEIATEEKRRILNSTSFCNVHCFNKQCDMALVAYASSDSGCSDDDDVDEVTIPAKNQQQVQSAQLVNKTDTVQTNPITNCVDLDGVKTPANSADQISDPHISDEEDIYPLPNSAEAHGLSLPAPKHSATENGLGLAENDGPSQSLESGLLAGADESLFGGTIHMIGVNRPAIVREILHCCLFPAFLRVRPAFLALY